MYFFYLFNSLLLIQNFSAVAYLSAKQTIQVQTLPWSISFGKVAESSDVPLTYPVGGVDRFHKGNSTCYHVFVMQRPAYGHYVR